MTAFFKAFQRTLYSPRLAISISRVSFQPDEISADFYSGSAILEKISTAIEEDSTSQSGTGYTEQSAQTGFLEYLKHLGRFLNPFYELEMNPERIIKGTDFSLRIFKQLFSIHLKPSIIGKF